VVDGDTIQVCCIGWKREKVRYIGINTPETKHPTKEVEHFGEEAAEANRKLVDGKTVRLEFDVQQQDKYGRTLAYIYLEDGTFVNAWLVENGYAMVMTFPPNVKYEGLFRKLQREAREARRGLWR
jgi:micrococcal nuclease